MSRKQQPDKTSRVADNDEHNVASALRLVDQQTATPLELEGGDFLAPDEAPDNAPDAGDGMADAPTVKRKKPKPKPQPGNKDKPSAIKGSRGVDTLLRNAYRAQLDMIALAATKANIMISLNGLLMSLLVLSGTHFLSIDFLYAIPIVLFLTGCALATVFAVLAARPDVSKKTFGFTDFERDEARLLVFEEFSDLNEDEYIEAMTRMLSDQRRVYRSMVSHVHELGCTADRKFRRLYYSYSLFMIGFVLAALSLVAVQALKWTGVIV